MNQRLELKHISILIFFGLGFYLLLFYQKKQLDYYELAAENLPADFNFGIVNSPVRISINNLPKSEENFLIVENPHLNRIKLIYNSNSDTISLGDSFSFDNRNIDFRNFVFSIESDPIQESIILEFDKSGENLAFTLKLLDKKKWDKYREMDNQMTGLIIGIGIFSIVLVFLTFPLKNSKKNIYFLIYLVLALIWIVNDRGILFQYLWPNNPFFHSLSRGIFSSFSMMLFAFYVFENKSQWIGINLKTVIYSLILFTLFKLFIALFIFLGIIPIAWKKEILVFNAWSLTVLFLTLSSLVFLKIIKSKKIDYEMMAIFIYCLFVLSLSLSELGIDFINLFLEKDFAMPLFLSVQIIFLGLHQKKQEEEIKKKKEKEYNDKIIEVENNEKQRIAQNIHDELGGIFSALKYQLLTIKAQNKIFDKENLENVTSLIDEGVKKQYSIIDDLMMDLDQENTLHSALLRQSGMIFKDREILININLKEGVNRLKTATKGQLFRIISELMTNTLKHSDASEINIYSESNQNLAIHYLDNGNGFDFNSNYNGNGIKNIKIRVEVIKGKINIPSVPKGFYIIINIPFYENS